MTFFEFRRAEMTPFVAYVSATGEKDGVFHLRFDDVAVL